ncbi:MAG: tetratricopeptide repeat protein [Fimbriimonadaceae bacterium]|nr:tetratricopeptide repeat protein [Fimbriimonadaceae bacterium]QYK58996.1 MAG: tetratricopeptide repeat protein [Fimbriimonadaceae bacterium]
MLTCRRCETELSPKAKWCPECGTQVSLDDLQAFRGTLTSRVGEGQRLFGTNRIAEALMVADSVLSVDPENVAALALKGDVLERMGDLTGALVCYETVVNLHPESPLDRIRVSQLRKRLSQPDHARIGDRKSLSPVLAGVAALVLIGAVGAAWALASQPKPLVSTAQAQEGTGEVSEPFKSPVPVPANPATQGNPTPKTTTPTQQESDERDSAIPAMPENRRLFADRRSGGGMTGLGGGLPSPLTESDSAGFRPLEVNVVPENRQTPQAQSPDPAPQAIQGDRNDESGSREPVTTSVIDIRPSPGQETTRTGGSEPVQASDRNQGETLVRVARQHFLAKDYERAAATYRKAIELGVSPASAYHRLAQCYKNMGRAAEAIDAYQNAVKAYETLLAAGRGDKALLESYISECRQAIKLLR